MSASKGKTLSSNQARVIFRQRLRDSRKPAAVLSDARNWLPVDLFEESIKWVLQQPALAPLLHARFPERTSDLGRYSPLQPTSFRREIAWARALLSVHAERLQHFLDLREHIQSEALHGRVTTALEGLDTLRMDLGISHWWIKHSLALRQLGHGIEAQKQFAAEMKSVFSPRSLNSYIVHQISVRNEPSVTPQRFISQLRTEINGMPLGESWKITSKYHVTGGWPATVTEAAHVLRHATAESIIDLYEALLYVARIVASSGFLTEEERVLARTLNALKNVISDPRLDSLIFVLKHGSSGNTRFEDLNGYTLFLNGDNAVSVRTATAELVRDPTLPGSYVLVALAGGGSSESKSLSARLLTCLTSIISKAEDVDIASGELDRIALALPGFEIIEALQAISFREMSPVPAVEGGAARPIIEQERIAGSHRIRYALSPIMAFHPLILRYLPEDLARELSTNALRAGLISSIDFPWGLQVTPGRAEAGAREQALIESYKALVS